MLMVKGFVLVTAAKLKEVIFNHLNFTHRHYMKQSEYNCIPRIIIDKY